MIVISDKSAGERPRTSGLTLPSCERGQRRAASIETDW